jgi:hypothetical protein
MTKRMLYVSAVVYFTTVIGFMTVPFTVRLINRIHPYILGFPCFQFFLLLSAVLIAIGLMALFLLEDRLEKKKGLRGGADD